MVSYMDMLVKRITDTFKKSGLWDNTIMIFSTGKYFTKLWTIRHNICCLYVVLNSIIFRWINWLFRCSSTYNFNHWKTQTWTFWSFLKRIIFLRLFRLLKLFTTDLASVASRMNCTFERKDFSRALLLSRGAGGVGGGVWCAGRGRGVASKNIQSER